MRLIDRYKLEKFAERYNGKGEPLNETELAQMERLSRLECREREAEKEEWPDCYADPGPAL